jgi:tRNA threonylcarbamoyladenosine biosynthesis protein TsaE
LTDRVLRLYLDQESATRALGARLAAIVRPGLIVYLRGELGAGKTTLVRALMQALGYPGKVKSPTYTLVELYKISDLCLYHFDFYRFSEPEEGNDAGFRDYFDSSAACFVEWPEKAGRWLPTPDLEISLVTDGAGRQAEIHARSDTGLQCLKSLARSA